MLLDLKFGAKVNYKKDRQCEQWFLGERRNPLAIKFLTFVKKGVVFLCQYLQPRTHDLIPQTSSSGTVGLIMNHYYDNYIWFCGLVLGSYGTNVCFTAV